MLDLKELLLSRAGVFRLELSGSLGLEFLLQVFHFKIHDDLDRSTDVVKHSIARNLFKTLFLLFKQVLCDIVQLAICYGVESLLLRSI